MLCYCDRGSQNLRSMPKMQTKLQKKSSLICMGQFVPKQSSFVFRFASKYARGSVLAILNNEICCIGLNARVVKGVEHLHFNVKMFLSGNISTLLNLMETKEMKYCSDSKRGATHRLGLKKSRANHKIAANMEY